MRMTKIKTICFIALSALLVLTACNIPQPPTDLQLAETAAMLTMTARAELATLTPTLTATPEPTETPTPTATVTPTPTMQPVGPYGFPDDVNPLTGLQVSDPSLLNRRPVLIKVANFPVGNPGEGRPHAGLSFADIVWEYYIGAGANRFLALYYGTDAEQVGPMRSGRLVDPQITAMYLGVLIYKSADVIVIDKIANILGSRGIIGHEGLCPAVCMIGPYSVYSFFGNSSAITDMAVTRGVDSKTRPVLDGMRFDSLPPAGGVAGQQANIIFNSANRGEWHYDAASGKYLRTIEDPNQNYAQIPLVDRLTDQQLAFSNVVVLFSYHTKFAETLYDMTVYTNTGGQPALIFRDGQAYSVTWKAVSQTAPIQFFDANGQAFALKPGNTWMVLMSLSSSQTQTDGVWDFQYVDYQ